MADTPIISSTERSALRRSTKGPVRNVFMKRDVHWWSVNDSDFSIVGSFNHFATIFFSLAAFFATWVVGFSFDLFMSDTLTDHKAKMVGWLIFLSAIGSVLCFAIAVVFLARKASHIRDIKKNSVAS